MSLGAIILAKCNLCFTYSFHISRVANVLFLNVCSFLRINNSKIHLLTSLSLRTHTWFVHLAVLYESVNWQENHHSQPPLCFAAAHLNLIWNERHFHIKNEFAFPLFLHSPPRSKIAGAVCLFFVYQMCWRRAGEGCWGVIQLSPVSREMGTAAGAFAGGWRVQLNDCHRC